MTDKPSASGRAACPAGGGDTSSPAKPSIPDAVAWALVERAKAMDAPDKTLDFHIWAEVGAGRYWKHTLEGYNPEWYSGPRYTESVDAAMALLPEGLFPVIDCDPRGPAVELQYLTSGTDNELAGLLAAEAKTPAIAMTIAALTAIATETEWRRRVPAPCET